MKNAYRHGELLFIETDKIPEQAKKTSSKVLAYGQEGNSHKINNGEVYLYSNGYIFGYLKAKNTSLLHSQHSPEVGDAEIPDGIYELRRGQEYINGELKVIID